MISMLRIAMGIDVDGKDVDLEYIYDGKYRDEWADWKVTGIYKKIMEEVFLTEQVYVDGYDEVINAIKEKTAENEDRKFLHGILSGLTL